MAPQRKTVKAKLAKRLITEVTRFFGGWDTMLSEIFQNVYRSKATRLDVTFDQNQYLLTFADDGVGCEDPQNLLSAGATGWDEEKVKAPAGLGFFSLFDPTVVSNVIVYSHNWRLAILPDKATTMEFKVERLKTSRKGFKIELHLQTDFVEKEVQHSRKLTITGLPDSLRTALTTYTYQLYLNGAPIENEELRFLARAKPIHSEEFGTMYLSTERQINGTAHVIWEDRMFRSTAFYAALRAAAGDKPDDLTKWLLADSSRHWLYEVKPHLIWRINTACGVQPKLPDRLDLISNGNLVRACEFWLATLADFFDDGRHRQWPDILHDRHALMKPVPDHRNDIDLTPDRTELVLRNEATAKLLLRNGWVPNNCTDLTKVDTERGDESWDLNVLEPAFEKSIWVRQGITVTDNVFLNLRNNFPLMAEHFSPEEFPSKSSVKEGYYEEIKLDWDPPLKVLDEMAGRRDSDDGLLYVAVARSITWRDENLAIYFCTPDEIIQYGCAILVAGTPAEVAAIISSTLDDSEKRSDEHNRLNDFITNQLLILVDDGDLPGSYGLSDLGWQTDDGNGEAMPDWQEINSDIRDNFLGHYFPGRLSDTEDLTLLFRIKQRLFDMQTEVGCLQSLAKSRKVGSLIPVVTFGSQFEQCEKQVDKLITQYKKKLQSYVTKVRKKRQLQGA
jgi:hypothetical protein